MTTLLYTHEACLAHDPGSYHPESPARLRAVLEGLEAPAFAALDLRKAPRAELEDIDAGPFGAFRRGHAGGHSRRGPRRRRRRYHRVAGLGRGGAARGRAPSAPPSMP